ncbi:hypothetical protein KUTeg_012386 [Tegillarca granosa]|uniref:Uncharacterized protein n=1 Tax=Tegillarca granosa TaxID=220873 RepID=A0ABQ9EZD9_TEGGR|nr:hypothetical protein KUTeg_012386 [Tegillarca granosa]
MVMLIYLITFPAYHITLLKNFYQQPCSTSTTEIGDGLDNDCDGLIDEELCPDGNGSGGGGSMATGQIGQRGRVLLLVPSAEA